MDQTIYRHILLFICGNVRVDFRQIIWQFYPEKTGGNKNHLHSTANHTLTIAEMPSHNHSLAMTDRNSDAGLIDRVHTQNYAVSGWWSWTSNAGGNQPHNHGNTGSASNLNPYLTCYIWKRTA